MSGARDSVDLAAYITVRDHNSIVTPGLILLAWRGRLWLLHQLMPKP